MELTCKISHPTVLALSLPSCAIVALDSRIYRPLYCEVVSDRYDKIIELGPTGFLGCFGDCLVIDQVRDALVAADLPNDRSIGEIALFVQNAVNTVMENFRGEDGEININRKARFVLVGGGDCDSRCYVYNISKGEETWMYLAQREVGRVTAGSKAVTTFLENNNLDENMTEGEAVDYAFKCMKYAVEHDWFAGGRIQVVAMKPGSSIVHTWEQNDPSICSNEYLYQEPRINNGH